MLEKIGPVIWKILAGIGILVGVGGAAFGADQQQKRNKEQAGHRDQLEKLKAQLATKEVDLAKLRSRLGEKNEQVHRLAEAVEKLRGEVDGLEAAA